MNKILDLLFGQVLKALADGILKAIGEARRDAANQELGGLKVANALSAEQVAQIRRANEIDRQMRALSDAALLERLSQRAAPGGG